MKINNLILAVLIFCSFTALSGGQETEAMLQCDSKEQEFAAIAYGLINKFSFGSNIDEVALAVQLFARNPKNPYKKMPGDNTIIKQSVYSLMRELEEKCSGWSDEKIAEFKTWLVAGLIENTNLDRTILRRHITDTILKINPQLKSETAATPVRKNESCCCKLI